MLVFRPSRPLLTAYIYGDLLPCCYASRGLHVKRDIHFEARGMKTECLLLQYIPQTPGSLQTKDAVYISTKIGPEWNEVIWLEGRGEWRGWEVIWNISV